MVIWIVIRYWLPAVLLDKELDQLTMFCLQWVGKIDWKIGHNLVLAPPKWAFGRLGLVHLLFIYLHLQALDFSITTNNGLGFDWKSEKLWKSTVLLGCHKHLVTTNWCALIYVTRFFYTCFSFCWSLACSYYKKLKIPLFDKMLIPCHKCSIYGDCWMLCWYNFSSSFSPSPSSLEITLRATRVTTQHKSWWGTAWFIYSCRRLWFLGLCLCRYLLDPFLESSEV